MQLTKIELQLIQKLLQQTNFPTADLKMIAAGLQRKVEAEMQENVEGEEEDE